MKSFMTDSIFVDTNILVYLFDGGSGEKHGQIKDVISQLPRLTRLSISSQVVNEFVNVVTRKIQKPLSFTDLRHIMDFLPEMFTVLPLTFSNSVQAIEIKDIYQYSYWDSLIISSALSNGCNMIFTEDMHTGQIIQDKLLIINPFK